jgi:hypothetical protein
MDKTRVPLYERLPEIYRIKDEEQSPPGQLRSYLALVERVFGAIHENIESLYDDLFIETCDDWVIPYIGDLLGTSRLEGDPWTLRADVADTVALRRRKGTLASIERLTYNLTRWGVHCVELRENLVWNHHLNHQRPDAGGDPPYGLSSVTRFTPIRGGTATLRDPAMLSLLGTPFDPFAHVADVSPPQPFGSVRYNLPNLAIFLWRLEDYSVPISRPLFRGRQPVGGIQAVRFDAHPLGEPVTLFNTYRFDPDAEPPVVTQVDETPGPIPRARLTGGSEAGNPQKYLSIDTYDPATVTSIDISEVGLQLHLPEPQFAGEDWPRDQEAWSIRGANLCAWEEGVRPSVGDREVIVDPAIGRIVIGVKTQAEATALKDHLLLTYTYGAVGPVGAHPTSRPRAREETDEAPVVEEVNFDDPAKEKGLERALDNLNQRTRPLDVEIEDSMIYELDIANVQGTIQEDGGANLRLNKPLVIRAAEDQRPVVRLKKPLRFRPLNAGGARGLTLRLEGLYLTRDPSFPANEPLISRAALERLEVVGCTLDPGGQKKLDGTSQGGRTPIRRSLVLREPYGFANPNDEKAFDQTPHVVVQRTIAGPLLIDGGYHLYLTDSIIDAGKGVGDDPQNSFAVTAATDPTKGWGPPTEVNGVTVFGRMRVETVNGRGGIWVHALEALNNQKGCIRFSYLSGQGDRLPQNLGCVRGTDAELRFASEVFGEPEYGQLAHTSDFRIRERGPRDDAMGAFGFLLEAHKWRNLQIRYREFMPVGVKPLLVPVT